MNIKINYNTSYAPFVRVIVTQFRYIGLNWKYVLYALFITGIALKLTTNSL